ncbi:hypothetical protein JKG68_28270 [Microvirga aerilata]|uniref:Uncharacterized protein n=1 Tax=Microvirga aerilata TaxID=670292 RepID=A0A937D263_9HYPH|nr:hypothetical protein [Microvirga aerilata]MBL0407806.1 hypothetical protein [Microvirga aerilata]
MDASSFDALQTPYTSLVNVEGINATEEARSSRARRKRKRSPKPKRDKRRKTWSKGITAQERKNLRRADGFATVIRYPLRATLDFHPVHLDAYPEGELDDFFAGLRTCISTWCGRRKIGCFWVWTRENYIGDRREHLHMVMHLPPRFHNQLEDHIRRLYPGGEKLVQIGNRTSHRCPDTTRWVDGLDYRTKQLRGDAVGAPGPTRLPRETKSRHDGAPVAPVYGKRCGISDSLTVRVEKAWEASRS